MNWKVAFVSLIALFLIVGLVYFQVIGIDIGIVSSIISLIGIFSPILSHFLKPTVSLTIEKPLLEKREYDGTEGYKIRTQVTNKGDKIVFNLTASVQFSKLVKFLRVSIETTNGHKIYKSSEETFKENEYTWIGKDGKKIKNPSLDQLRKDDSIRLVFPKEIEHGLCYALLNGPSHAWSRDTLLKLDKGKNYQILITLKGEDYEKNTVVKTEKFEIKVAT